MKFDYFFGNEEEAKKSLEDGTFVGLPYPYSCTADLVDDLTCSGLIDENFDSISLLKRIGEKWKVIGKLSDFVE